MKITSLLAISALALTMIAPAMPKPGMHTRGVGSGSSTGALKAGEYWWKPERSASGPVIVLVSIPQQTMNVYRNGVLIGRSSVSTGAKGHSTPGGVFTILEKKKDHYSKKYDNAPMPNMQRLTWTGIAMHSGNIPGYPASHGCVRMPYDFSQLLFGATSKGGTVVIADGKTPVPYLAGNPGLMLAPKDLSPDMLRPLANNGYEWKPERATKGPITILLSSADRTVYVYRDGTPIGRASVEISNGEDLGDHVFTMLEGDTGKVSWLVPGRTGRRWMSVTNVDGTDPEKIISRLRINPEFTTELYDELTPGTTVVITSQPLVRKEITSAIFQN